MEIIRELQLIAGLILLILIGFSSLYILVFSIGGLFYRDKKMKSDAWSKMAVLIPGYKEDSVIIEVASQALQQDYPEDLFDVVVIADSFQKETLDKLSNMDLKLIEVSFDKSTKSKALNRAMEILRDDYDLAVILDADNVMETGFLAKVDQYFNDKIQVLQCHRVAKNLNSSFAILDAISEEINNHIFRKGHRALGFSSALIGSAMVFRYPLFRQYMKEIKAVGGFDKEMELRLLRDRVRIHYYHDARVLDEKIQHSSSFQGQRKRWLSAQFVYFGRFIGSGLKELLLRFNTDFFDKVIQMILIPRILLAGILVLINLFLWFDFLFPSINIFPMILLPYWTGSLLITVLAMLFAIPRKFYDLSTLKALLSLPRGFFLMFRAILSLKGANKKFIHTKHG